MLKKLIQQLTPSFLLKRYKKKQYIDILRNFDITTQPEVKIAGLLADKHTVFVDIGANIGLYTKELSPLSEKVIAFEPVPFTFEMLRNTIHTFSLKNAEAFPFAISDTNGEADIEVPVQAGVLNYYRASLDHPESEGERKIHTVVTKTFDSVFLNYEKCLSLIKCDVEGHELAVIKGASDFLKRNDTPWLMEISTDPDQDNSPAARIFSIMKKAGFEIYLLENGVLRTRRKGDESINYFFLKDQHVNKLSKHGVKTKE